MPSDCAFGMVMPGRNYSAGSEYRYGFNGQEISDEVFANSSTAEFWQYDARIGRRWNTDPVLLANESPYLVNGGNPILFLDPLGDFKTKFGAQWNKFWNGGNKVGKNKYGEWYVERDPKKERAKGDGKELLEEVVVGQERYYGKGRKAHTAAAEMEIQKIDRQQIIDKLTEQGIWDPNMPEDEARFSALKLGAELVLPNPILKSGTAALNMSVLARRIRNGLSKKISQRQIRHLAGTAENIKNGGGFMNSIDDAQTVLDAVHSGQATLLGINKAGFPVYKYKGVTGTNVNVGVGITDQATNVFIIKGTTNPSVVPTTPYWKP